MTKEKELDGITKHQHSIGILFTILGVINTIDFLSLALVKPEFITQVYGTYTIFDAIFKIGLIFIFFIAGYFFIERKVKQKQYIYIGLVVSIIMILWVIITFIYGFGIGLSLA